MVVLPRCTGAFRPVMPECAANYVAVQRGHPVVLSHRRIDAPARTARRKFTANSGPITDSATPAGYPPGAANCAAERGWGRTLRRNDAEETMLVDLIVWLVVGAVAGWLAGLLIKGYGFGLIGNIIVGIVGGLIAGWLLPKLGIFSIGGIAGSIIYSVIGAVILLLIVGLIKR
jgi:uncharacterized membrane protein YeaQ/YmgE (transglycosylase-associated protein family)